jgi:Peptidase inhibitor family I36
MKNQIAITTLLALGLTLAITSAAPAQSVERRVTPAKVKVQTRIPLTKSMTSEARRPAPPREQASAEVCVFEHTNFQGSRFCTKDMNFLMLPPAFHNEMSSARVPQGYKLMLYERANKSGTVCMFFGEAGTLGNDGCNDMAVAISLEVDPDFARKAAEPDNTGFAPNLQENQEAQRRADAAALKARNIAQAGACPVEVFSTDGSFPNRRCIAIEQSIAYVGDNWNDDIERVQVTSGYAQFIGYEGANFQGRRVNLGCGYWELVGDPENEISSIRVEYVSLGDEVYCGTRDQELNAWR